MRFQTLCYVHSEYNGNLRVGGSWLVAERTRRAGQIIKRGERKYLVRIFLGKDASGKRKYFSKIINEPKRSAQEWLTAQLRDQELGLFVEHASMSVNAYLDKCWTK